MILDGATLLSKLSTLNTSNSAVDSAPHKPLLLLSIMDLIESGFINSNPIARSAELTYQFLTYSRIVAHRRGVLDIRLPFHHMGGDGIWEPLDAQLRPSPDKKLTLYAKCSDGVWAAFNNAEFREQARIILISRWFLANEQVALAATLGMSEIDFGSALKTIQEEDRSRAIKQGRDIRFRLVVVAAYKFTCCLTRHRLTTMSRGSLVDAAHIHQFSDSRNNDPRNGLALSKNAHWMFDQGLWTINDDLTVKVAKAHYSESNPHGKELEEFDGVQILCPDDSNLTPDPLYLAWHRKKKFLDSLGAM